MEWIAVFGGFCCVGCAFERWLSVGSDSFGFVAMVRSDSNIIASFLLLFQGMKIVFSVNS